jgi:hypothetical protein
LKHIIQNAVYFFILTGFATAIVTRAENESVKLDAKEYAKSIETAFFKAKELEEKGYIEGALEAYAECVDLFKEATRQYGFDIEELSGYAAESAFEIAEANFVNYDRIRLVMPQKTMEANISKRLELSRWLVDYYRYCVDLGIPEWTIAAKVRMGDVDYSFAEALCNAELPPEIAPDNWSHLPPDDENRLRSEKMYRNYVRALEEQALPLYDQALMFYADALKIAGAYDITNEWTRRAGEKSETVGEKIQNLRIKDPPRKEPRKFKIRGQ